LSPSNHETEANDRSNLPRKASVAVLITKSTQEVYPKVMKNLQTDKRRKFSKKVRTITSKY